MINNAAFGTLHGGDTVNIPFKTGGYRSYSMNKVGTINEGSYIVVLWASTAFITPDLGLKQANNIDSCFWVKTIGMVMNDNIDVAFTTYANTGYSQHMYFLNCTYRGMNGFFQSVAPTLSIPNFNGDTTQCFKDWTWDHVRWDSLVGANSGNTALWLGKIAQNQYWLRPTIVDCYFGHYSSSGGPANYLQITNCYNLVAARDTFDQLGMDVPLYVGHAAVIFIQEAKFDISNCVFGDDNFGTDIRIFGVADLLVTGFMGKSHVYNNITRKKKKYAFVENRDTPADTTTLSPWIRIRPCPDIIGNTFYSPAVGVGQTPYGTALVEEYKRLLDTIILKNNVIAGPPRDSSFTISLTMYSGSGGPYGGQWDSASNKVFQTWAPAGIADSILYKPTKTGQLYGTGVTPPSYITSDFYGIPRPLSGRTDIGFAQFIDFIGPIRVGVRIVAQ